MPNRATLMTGRMPSLHGVRHNGIPLSWRATTFTDIMAAAGYHTALIGKCHLQSIKDDLPVIGIPEPDPQLTRPPERLREARKDIGGRYDQELPSTWAKDPEFEPVFPYYGFQHVELCIKHADQVVGHYERWLRERHPDPDSLRGAKNQLPGNDYRGPQAWRTRMPEELYPTSYVAERTMAFLEEHVDSGQERPFFLQCSFPDPHHAFTPPAGTGTSTIRTKSPCRRRSIAASIRCCRTWPGSTRSATGAKPTATASAASPSPSGRRGKPSPSPTA